MARKKICGIYKITNPNGHIYIGQSINVLGRISRHKCSKKGQNRIERSIQKYGNKNHTFEIIEICEENILDEREIFWIKHFDTWNTDHGMNLKEGGKNGKGRASDETKAKLRETHLGWKHSDVTKKIISENSKKYRHTPESLKKIIDFNLGSKRSEESKKKMSESATKRLLTNHPSSKLIFDLETGIYYSSLKEASKAINKSIYILKILLNNKNKTKFIYA